jgi:glyoxylase-like metal-dependent hydrolase (beta-lactamase superfamily II)
MRVADARVLVEGYLKGERGESGSCATITLVRDGGLVMVIDPGTLKEPKVLLERLAAEGVLPEDVNVVCVTHSHMDHYRNIGLFPNAKALDYWGLWDRDSVKEVGARLSDGVEVVKTPGHSFDGISVFVKTRDGVIAVCGDVFWKKDFPEKDLLATDEKALAESRKLVLGKADWVVPGHENMYKVEREHAQPAGK